MTTAANVVTLHPREWTPDEMLIEAAFNGRLHAADLARDERAWLVAQLTYQGHPTEQIAAWLHCCIRTIKSDRNKPIAVLTIKLLQLDAELQQAKKRRPDTAKDLVTDLVREVDRLKATKNTLIDQLAAATARARTPQKVYVEVTPPRPNCTNCGRTFETATGLAIHKRHCRPPQAQRLF